MMVNIVSLKEDSKKEWNMLVQNYSKNIYNIALNFTKNSEEAADITQDIFIKIYRNINKYKDKSSFKAWLIRIAKNHCIDHWRKNKKHQDNMEINDNIHTDNSATPEERIIADSERELLRQKLKALPENIRILIIMRDIEGYSYNKISQEFNLPLGTIKSRINRGRLKLAKIFSREVKNAGLS
jgi:RNA polymerase sigma-70 factor (ECF subfamily)